MSLTDAILHAWLAGALEPPRALEVEEAMRREPGIAERLARLRALQTEPRADPWRIPPPGIAGGRAGIRANVEHAAVLGGALRAGDRFELVMDDLPDAAARWVVVLRRETAGWRVVFPTEPEDQMPLAALPLDDGVRRLALTASAAPRQRWAVALPAASVSIDWTLGEAARWEPVIAGVQDGSIPTASVELELVATA